MSASTLTFAALFVVTVGILAFVIWKTTRRIAASDTARSKIKTEEDRVFAFLHSLGEAFSEGVRSADLHRLIVENASRILDSHGGALYLVDKTETALAPAFLSGGCPPLIHVPPHVIDQVATVPIAVDSYLKLHAVPLGEGLLGETWELGTARLIQAGDFSANADRPRSLQLHSALVAPLIYRRKVLGVLAVANGPMSQPFGSADLKLFQTICEQSAFALYNEIVYLEANEKKRLDHDLAVAREIQSILLPSDPPPIPGYEISGINIPARHVSGDYFDYIVVDEHRTGIAIADVSGKGIPASLVMTMCRSVIRSQAPGKTSAADLLHRVNRQLYPDIREDMFISMLYVILDGQNDRICLGRAGHDAPYLRRAATGDIETINPKGMALGIDSGEVFDRVSADFHFQMHSGDCLLLYTDGATEALDADGNEFGITRMLQGLEEGAATNASGIVRAITDSLKEFVDGYQQHDDITLIAIRKL